MNRSVIFTSCENYREAVKLGFKLNSFKTREIEDVIPINWFSKVGRNLRLITTYFSHTKRFLN